jgi:hypothetical protein
MDEPNLASSKLFAQSIEVARIFHLKRQPNSTKVYVDCSCFIVGLSLALERQSDTTKVYVDCSC